MITDLFSTFHSEPRIFPDHVQLLVLTHRLERTINHYIAGVLNRFTIEEDARLHDLDLKP